MAEPPAKRCKTTTNGDVTDGGTAVEASQTPPGAPAPGSSVQTPSLYSTLTKYKPDDLVTLIVGPTKAKAKFIAHGHHLARSSDFFRTALKKEWKEGQTRIIHLQEDEVEDVANYLDYIYDGELPTRNIVLVDHMAAEHEDQYPLLARLYAFGERVLNTAIRNAVITEMVRLTSLTDDDGWGYFPYWSTSTWLYRKTVATSPMRRFIVDMYVTYGLSTLEDEDDENLAGSSEILADIVKQFNKMAASGQSADEWCGKDLEAKDYLL